MRETLEVINRMQAEGVIAKYAIGGAVGATLYLEPSATVDIDIFVVLPGESNTTLVSLSLIYKYLTALGCRVDREYIVIGTWPVQFLLPNNALVDEAVTRALEVEVEGVRTWIMSAEHLVAIALQTGRAKDHARILQFLEQKASDPDKLERILERHGLISKWKQFRQRYLDE